MSAAETGRPVGRADAYSRASRIRRWASTAILLLFGLFFAYDVWEAVGNLVGVSRAAGDLDTSLNGLGWVVLLGGILLPGIVYGGALWLGRRRGPGVLAALLLAGLCLVAVLALNSFALFSFARLIV